MISNELVEIMLEILVFMEPNKILDQNIASLCSVPWIKSMVLANHASHNNFDISHIETFSSSPLIWIGQSIIHIVGILLLLPSVRARMLAIRAQM